MESKGRAIPPIASRARLLGRCDIYTALKPMAHHNQAAARRYQPRAASSTTADVAYTSKL